MYISNVRITFTVFHIQGSIKASHYKCRTKLKIVVMNNIDLYEM